jgi:uncharacterized linocin/CFP29 family protein
MDAVIATYGTTNGPATNNLGRHKIDWDDTIWDSLDRQVCAEVERARVTTKFLPVMTGSMSSSARTVPADSIQSIEGTLSIAEGAELALEERSVPFILTKQQYHEEGRLRTAVTLATRAANRLAQEMDFSIFQGGLNGNLLSAAEATEQIVDVPLLDDGIPDEYGENAFAAVADAYALLESKGHYGPDALVFQFKPFADAHAPLRSTLIMPADRIRPLMSAGFYGTGTLPPKRGIMVSTGGDTMDVAIGVDAVTAFTQVDENEVYRFRVYERFTVRVKDPTALVLLRFA